MKLLKYSDHETSPRLALAGVVPRSLVSSISPVPTFVWYFLNRMSGILLICLLLGLRNRHGLVCYIYAKFCYF